MDIITCNGEQFKNLQSGRRDNISNDYIGFRCLKVSDLHKDSLFSFIADRSRLIGVIKYKIDVRQEKGLKGLLGHTFLYITLYYIDIRSDKKGKDKELLVDYLIDEFSNVLKDDYTETKLMMNITSFRGSIDKEALEERVTRKLGKVFFIRKGHKRYGR